MLAWAVLASSILRWRERDARLEPRGGAWGSLERLQQLRQLTRHRIVGVRDPVVLCEVLASAAVRSVVLWN